MQDCRRCTGFSGELGQKRGHSRGAASFRLLGGLLAGLLLSGGCAALGWHPPGARPLSKVPLAADKFVAPRAVLQVAWHRPLVSKIEFFSYKPQEFSAATTSTDGELVYIGSSTKIFQALRVSNGEQVWKRELTGAVSSEPLYLGAGMAGPEALVLVGDDDGVLSALDAKTGVTKWSYRARGPIHSQPVLHGALVYVTSSEGRVYGLDVRTGKWVWQYDRETTEGFAIRGSAGVLPVGNRVYSGFPDGYLACLNAETGEVIWTRQLSGDSSRFTDVDSTPVLVGDTLYVSCFAGGLYALDVKDGSTRWRYELEAAGPFTIDAAAQRVYIVSATQGLFCLDTKGRKVWQQAMPQQGELSVPTQWSSYVLVAAASSGLHVFDKETGELLQFFDPGQGATGRPVVAAGRAFLLSNAGSFFALAAH